MTENLMYRHLQKYRRRWYRTKKTIEEIESPDVDVERWHAHMAFQINTKLWVQRIEPLDTVENMYSEIWHDRELGPFDGLSDALHNGLRGDDSDPLPVPVLVEIGTAAEEITVDAVGLPPQPPVDVDPWEPSPESAKEILKQTKELRQTLPDYE